MVLNRTTIALRKVNLASETKGLTKTGGDWRKTMEPISYACFSAIFGTQAVIFSKCLALLLKAGGAFSHWLIYCTLVGWLVFVYVWLKRMNDALGKYSALFIIPLLQANYILLAIINGGIFFDEFRGFKAIHWFVFSIGLLGIFWGLYLLRPEVEDDDAIDTAIVEHEESSQFLPKDSISSRQASESSASSLKGKQRRVSIGGISRPPTGAPKQIKKNRRSVYLPAYHSDVVKVEKDGSGKIQERRRTLSGQKAKRLSLSTPGSMVRQRSSTFGGMLKGNLQMKRVSLATSFTSAALLDAKLTDNMHEEAKVEVVRRASLRGIEEGLQGGGDGGYNDLIVEEGDEDESESEPENEPERESFGASMVPESPGRQSSEIVPADNIEMAQI